MAKKQTPEIMLPALEEIEDVEKATLEDYQKLNQKCDIIITKIKNRKNKKSRKMSQTTQIE